MIALYSFIVYVIGVVASFFFYRWYFNSSRLYRFVYTSTLEIVIMSLTWPISLLVTLLLHIFLMI
jgi:hypothetical protein